MSLSNLVALFDGVCRFIYFGIWLSYSIGKAIVIVLSFLLDLSYNIFTILGQFMVLFYEEYSNFLNELVENVSWLLNAISEVCVNGMLHLFNGGKSVLDSGYTLLRSGNLKLANFGHGILFSLGWLVEKSKKLVIMFGGGVWFVVTLLPNSIYNLLAHMYGTTYASFNFMGDLCVGGWLATRSNLLSFWEFFRDVPLQSLLGLMFMYAVYKKREPVAIYGGRFVLKMFRICRTVMTKVYILFGRLLSMRTRVETQYDDLFNDSASPVRITTSPTHRSQLNVPVSPTARQPTRRKPIKTASNSPQKNADDNADSNLCIICQDARKSVVLFPCRHLCLCAGCSDNLSRYRRECPLCRSPIFRQINVFL